jgi:hypothetical protein
MHYHEAAINEEKSRKKKPKKDIVSERAEEIRRFAEEWAKNRPKPEVTEDKWWRRPQPPMPIYHTPPRYVPVLIPVYQPGYREPDVICRATSYVQ